MRFWLTLFIWCGLIAAARADEPEVSVFCPAIGFDDYDGQGNSYDDPRRVELMVVGRTIRNEQPSPRKKETSEVDPFNLRPGQEAKDLVVERVLFGSPPGARIHIPADYNGRGFPKDSNSVSYIYGFVSNRENEAASYDRDNYFFSRRTYVLEELPLVEALAQARLDLLVLSSYAVFVGTPLSSTDKKNAVSQIQAKMNAIPSLNSFVFIAYKLNASCTVH